MSWPEAKAFCDWLTDYERKSGWIENQSYRLPTDVEWSAAAGLKAAATAGAAGLYELSAEDLVA